MWIAKLKGRKKKPKPKLTNNQKDLQISKKQRNQPFPQAQPISRSV